MGSAKNLHTGHRGVLYFTSKGGSEEAIKLRRDSTIFGREKGDIIIDDHEVSSTHFQIQNINDSFHIFDMNSTNGTYVNDERIVRARLSSGDTINVGKTSFKFMVEEESQIRHISTIFSSHQGKRSTGDHRVSVVDTLIENELKEGRTWGIVINVTYHNGKSEEIPIEQNVVYVGRASSFGQFDQDSEISRKHLKIKVNEQGEIFVEDQGSTNGSYINGTRIEGLQPAKPSDVIKVGLCHLRLRTLSD
ncbi:MAG: FHA domain-containing protein [Bdellovibrionota bacterium]